MRPAWKVQLPKGVKALRFAGFIAERSKLDGPAGLKTFEDMFEPRTTCTQVAK